MNQTKWKRHQLLPWSWWVFLVEWQSWMNGQLDRRIGEELEHTSLLRYKMSCYSMQQRCSMYSDERWLSGTCTISWHCTLYIMCLASDIILLCSYDTYKTMIVRGSVLLLDVIILSYRSRTRWCPSWWRERDRSHQERKTALTHTRDPTSAESALPIHACTHIHRIKIITVVFMAGCVHSLRVPPTLMECSPAYQWQTCQQQCPGREGGGDHQGWQGGPGGDESIHKSKNTIALWITRSCTVINQAWI